MNKIKPILIVSLVALSALAITACKNLESNAKKTEYALTQLADGSMKSWAVYYHTATNDPSFFHKTIDQVEMEHARVNVTARRSAASLRTLDTFIAVYHTNSATSGALDAALIAASSTIPELTAIIADITGKTNVPVPSAIFSPLP